MPNKNGTGPEGKGAKTGRGLGNCDSNKSSEENKSYGRKSGKGRGQGYQHGNRGK
jgi:Family of unknown function (DUF5320)